MPDQDLKTELSLPIRQPTFYILLSLAPGPRHGYAILHEVEEMSRGEIRLSTGTLYEAVARLLEQGWIEREPGPDNPSDELGPGKPRKTYRLTALGRQMLEAEIGRMQSLVRTARRRLNQTRI